MKKRSIKFEVNFTNKWIYTFIALGVVLVLAIGVFAYNSGKAPSVMGHSGEEIMVSVNGQEVSLNEALSEGTTVIFDEVPINLFCLSTNGNVGIKSGTIRAGTTELLPREAKEVLLYGIIDLKTDLTEVYFGFKFPSQKYLKPLVYSLSSAKYPNTNSLWVPLDSNGELYWELVGLGSSYSSKNVDQLCMRIFGYKT